MNRIKVSTYAKRVGLSPQAVRSYFHSVLDFMDREEARERLKQ